MGNVVKIGVQLVSHVYKNICLHIVVSYIFLGKILERLHTLSSGFHRCNKHINFNPAIDILPTNNEELEAGHTRKLLVGENDMYYRFLWRRYVFPDEMQSYELILKQWWASCPI